jgi:SRSO17 transposase
MKISEAMLLGSTMIQPVAGVHLDTFNSAGCAMGMVNIAAPSLWKELGHRCRITQVKTPCDCTVGFISRMQRGPVYRANNLMMTIVHLFNDHVMTKKDWTLDRLIEWVASVEPADPGETVTERASEETRCAELVARS